MASRSNNVRTHVDGCSKGFLCDTSAVLKPYQQWRRVFHILKHQKKTWWLRILRQWSMWNCWTSWNLRVSGVEILTVRNDHCIDAWIRPGKLRRGICWSKKNSVSRYFGRNGRSFSWSSPLGSSLLHFVDTFREKQTCDECVLRSSDYRHSPLRLTSTFPLEQIGARPLGSSFDQHKLKDAGNVLFWQSQHQNSASFQEMRHMP